MKVLLIVEFLCCGIRGSHSDFDEDFKSSGICFIATDNLKDRCAVFFWVI